MARLTAVSVLALLCAGAFAPTVAHADVLLIERVEAARQQDLPTRGSSMDDVIRRFGEPSMRHEPVGGGSPQRPPITRWDYPQFSVYFENRSVINSVLARSFAEETGPKPID